MEKTILPGISKMFPNRVLTPSIRNDIRADFDQGLNFDQLLNKYGLTRAKIKAILMSNYE